MMQTKENLDLIWLEKAWIIHQEESRIPGIKKDFYYEPQCDVILMTFSPDPSQLPDCDFVTQAEYWVQPLADYLKTCDAGLFCVEANTAGRPHFHGWYIPSKDPLLKLEQLAHQKTFERFAPSGIKYTKLKVFRPHCWSERMNGLYYYKKDTLQDMLMLAKYPVTKDSEGTAECEFTMFFRVDIKTRRQIGEHISLRRYYMDFYKQSRPNIDKLL